MRTSTVIKALLAATAVAPLLCHAESNLQTAASGALSATAHVDFTITIPKFLFLRVGNGTGAINAAGVFTVGNAPATNTAIDVISWTPGPAQVGTGPLAGTGGDLTNGVETAIVVANNGAVTLTSTTGGALNDGAAGDKISWSQITTTATTNNTVAVLQAPTLLDSGNGSVTVNPNFGTKVVAQDAKWTYSYLNATVPPAGTYGGVGVQNGRVLYTASLP